MTVQVSVEEAARRLGVSSITVRRRLLKGQLEAEKVETPQGHQWLVHLDDEASGPGDQSPAEAATAQPPTPPIEQIPATDALAREIARLEAHNQDLRGQLDDRVREIERLHTILSQTVRALPVPEPQPVESPAPVSERPIEQESTQNDAPLNHETGRRGWWPRLSGWLSGA
jgi:excisionase family DNA binding protein